MLWHIKYYRSQNINRQISNTNVVLTHVRSISAEILKTTDINVYSYEVSENIEEIYYELYYQVATDVISGKKPRNECLDKVVKLYRNVSCNFF